MSVVSNLSPGHWMLRVRFQTALRARLVKGHVACQGIRNLPSSLSFMSSDSSHEYIRGTEGRSPCPALNALANHGYLPRDGKNIGIMQLVSAITSVYNVSYSVAFALATGGMYMCGSGFSLNLEDLRAHNSIEHDASMVHRDLDETGGTLPSNKPDTELIQAVIDLSDGKKITLDDLIRHKYNREVRIGHPQKPMNKKSLLISRGEPILCNHALNRDGSGIPIEWFRTWLGEERIPEGLAPRETLDLITLRTRARALGEAVDALHGKSAKSEPEA